MKIQALLLLSIILLSIEQSKCCWKSNQYWWRMIANELSNKTRCCYMVLSLYISNARMRWRLPLERHRILGWFVPRRQWHLCQSGWTQRRYAFDEDTLTRRHTHNDLVDLAGQVTITRDCLSTLNSGFRTDLPADRYEGCREASQDVRLGHYIFNNTIKELDIQRNHFDSTTFCYCFLDHRCNSSISIKSSVFSIALFAVLGYFVVANISRWVDQHHFDRLISLMY